MGTSPFSSLILEKQWIKCVRLQTVNTNFSNESILAEAGVVTPLCFNVRVDRCTCFISDNKKEDYKKYDHTLTHYRSSLHSAVAA